MRVAFIHPFMYRFRRGIERFIWNTSNALSREGVDVSILTWKDPLNYQLDALDAPVHMNAYGPFRYFAAWRAIPCYVFDLLKHDYHLVNICFAGYGEAETLAITRRIRRIPFNILFLYPLQYVPHRYLEFERYGLIKGADRLFSMTSYVAEGVKHLSRRDSQVITGGVDTSKFRPNVQSRQSTRTELGLDSDIPVLITVCALERHKGVDQVIRALPLVIDKYPQLKYLVVGEGPFRPVLENLVAELHLTQNVHLLGSQPEIAPFLSAADVFLLLSTPDSEALGIAVLEAMAAELPVIVSEGQPFTEFVTTDCGAFVPPANCARVAQEICNLLEHPDRRRALGASGRSWVIDKYSWSQVARQYKSAFEQQLALQSGWKA